MLTEFERKTCEFALRRMFRTDGWVDITVLRTMVQTSSIIVPPGEWNMISLLHCVHWRDMEPEYRNDVAKIILGWFTIDPFDPFETKKAIAPVSAVAADDKKPGILGYLLGKG